MEDQFLAFDWKGFMAHFRQFDTNSSSLSYSFPPPTVVYGMLAGLMGIEKDQYYKRFSHQYIRVGVQIVTPPRKLMQTVNYIFAKGPQDLNMSGENLHTQIPMELLLANGFPNEPLHYRIFLKISEPGLADDIREVLVNARYRYLPFLGSAPFSSWLEWLGPPEIVEPLDASGPVVVDTVAPLMAIELRSLLMEPLDGVWPAYFREHVRQEFLPGRQPGAVQDVVWERNRGKLKARFLEPPFRLVFRGKSWGVSFL